MHRIDTANAVADLFGAGKKGFGAGDPGTNTPATFLNADWCNAIQEELAAIVEAKFGLDKADRGQVLKALKSTFLSNDQIIDRTGLTATLLLDRFDVIHKYRLTRALAGNGVSPQVVATTGLVQGAIYDVLVQTETGTGLENLDFSLRPNSTTYANQFTSNFVTMTDPAASTNAIAYRNGVNGVAASESGRFSIDTYNGGFGSNGVIRLTAFVQEAAKHKKLFITSGDTAGSASGIGIWLNNTTAWTVLGTLGFYTVQNSPTSDYSIDVFVRRIA